MKGSGHCQAHPQRVLLSAVWEGWGLRLAAVVAQSTRSYSFPLEPPLLVSLGTSYQSEYGAVLGTLQTTASFSSDISPILQTGNGDRERHPAPGLPPWPLGRALLPPSCSISAVTKKRRHRTGKQLSSVPHSQQCFWCGLTPGDLH